MLLGKALLKCTAIHCSNGDSQSCNSREHGEQIDSSSVSAKLRAGIWMSIIKYSFK